MFHKPFRVKSNTAVKSSERRKTRSTLEEQLRLNQETSSLIIPNKDEMTIAKMVSHSGEILNVFVVNKTPILIEDRSGTLYPTLTLLWRFPDLLPRFRTWETVFHKLCGGADLMLPGVVVKGHPTMENLHGVRKSQPVAIHVAGNVAPVAVAYATMSARDMISSGMRGKGFIIVHTANDELFKFGKEKPQVPLIADVELAAGKIDDDDDAGDDSGDDDAGDDSGVDDAGDAGDVAVVMAEDNSANMENRTEATNRKDTLDTAEDETFVDETERNDEVIESSCPVEEENKIPTDDHERSKDSDDRTEKKADDETVTDDRESLTGFIADLLLGTGEEEEEEKEEERDGVRREASSRAEEVTDNQVPVAMDDRLSFYLKIAIKFHLRTADLPVTTQEMYKAMQAACPQENILDFRKSTFKKPLKFFQEIQSQGLLKLKEETKGVWMITQVEKKCELMRLIDFNYLPFLERNLVDEAEEDVDSFQPPVVREMLSVNAAVLPLFRDAGVSKGSGVSDQDMRKIVTEYVRKNELCGSEGADKARVRMNPEIAGILLEKGENNVFELTWNQVFQRLAKKMGQCYSLEYPGQPPIFKKGGLPPVTLNVETRSGNKKVTLVTNLETFGVNPHELGKEIRVRAAASTSVSAAPGQKVGCKQLLIQGNQVNLVVAILTEKYNIDKKHICGVEKGEKKKKR